jgi:glutathione synthase/RimK-type ligase-like ATP-grasp enzyme
MSTSITLVTAEPYVNPTNRDWYIQNILDEDELTTNALIAEGFRVDRTNWDNPTYDWSKTDYVLFRATWDYFDRYEEFFDWLTRTSQVTHFINSIELVTWNLDKHYLNDLHTQGIRIPPTQFIQKGKQSTLQKLVAETRWTELILKPAISGAARHTYRINPASAWDHEAIFHSLIANEAMLLQEFQPSVLTKGEVTFVLFGGRYSHALVKKPKRGDFRVQDDFGGTLHEYSPSQEEIKFAEHVLTVCPSIPVYARVDCIWNDQDELCVSEVELIEPELWLRKHASASAQFAKAINLSINEVG